MRLQCASYLGSRNGLSAFRYLGLISASLVAIRPESMHLAGCDNGVRLAPRPDGEIGRRSGLKIRRPQGRGGSSPPPGTITQKTEATLRGMAAF